MLMQLQYKSLLNFNKYFISNSYIFLEINLNLAIILNIANPIHAPNVFKMTSSISTNLILPKIKTPKIIT